MSSNGEKLPSIAPETGGRNDEANICAPDDADEPLKKLAEGMKLIENGRFDVRLEEWPNEPYRSIFASFNNMAESLLSIESMRESFVSNVAHEFKTPLSYIQGYATLLQDDDLSQEKRVDYCQHVNNATRRLANMIGNLLEISNLTRPTAEFETHPFSLDEQLRHVMAILLPQMGRKQINYGVNFERVDIDGNKSLLEDVWMNLIENAIKYTQPGGLIQVKLEKRGNDAVVVVTDNGCGMTEIQMHRAFDRFYQGDASHVSEGTGLGLAIVKAVVKKHGGSISLNSKLGCGTAFTVTLPVGL